MAKSHNRKLPADDVIRAAYYDEGLTIVEIAGRHGVSPNSLHCYFIYQGWRKRGTSVAKTASPPKLAETAQKILLHREGFVTGRGNAMVEFAISLPRIPTIHGHFTAAAPSMQGA